MKNKTILTNAVFSLVDKEADNGLSVEKEGSEQQKTAQPKSSLEKQRRDKISQTIAEEKKLVKNKTLAKKPSEKNKQPRISTQVGDENLKIVQARKLQMMTQTGREPASASPLQMHLVQSESLKVAQEKLSDLEEEILSLREKNSALVSAGEVLKENNSNLKAKLEDLKFSLSDEKKSFEDEKEVLVSAMEEARDQILLLRNKNQELEKRISSSFHGIRQRENSLEGRIEILKMENSAVQKEKDRKILDFKKEILKLKHNLENAHKKNHELDVLTRKLKESSRRAVSALRATIYNLEGVKLNEKTVISQSKKVSKAS